MKSVASLIQNHFLIHPSPQEAFNWAFGIAGTLCGVVPIVETTAFSLTFNTTPRVTNAMHDWTAQLLSKSALVDTDDAVISVVGVKGRYTSIYPSFSPSICWSINYFISSTHCHRSVRLFEAPTHHSFSCFLRISHVHHCRLSHSVSEISRYFRSYDFYPSVRSLFLRWCR